MSDIIFVNGDNTLGFGDYTLAEKTKFDNFAFGGDTYQVKSFKDFTKLEKNENLVYESIPGTTVAAFAATEHGVSAKLTGNGETSVTFELKPETFYKVFVDKVEKELVNSGIAGKVSISVDLVPETSVVVDITEA